MKNYKIYRYNVFFSLPQNSRCLVIEFHEKNNTIIVLLGRRKFLCFVNSNRVLLGNGENPNSHYTNKCAMPPRAVYESIFLRLFFWRSYLSHISCSRRAGCKQRLLPTYLLYDDIFKAGDLGLYCSIY